MDVILGDAIPSTAHRVMAAVFDGDTQSPSTRLFVTRRPASSPGGIAENIVEVTLENGLTKIAAKLDELKLPDNWSAGGPACRCGSTWVATLRP